MDVRGRAAISRPVLLGLAMVYAAATVVYSGSWMYYIRKARQAALGVDFRSQ